MVTFDRRPTQQARGPAANPLRGSMVVSHETVSKSMFKSRALEYFRLVERSGKEIVITDRGRPVARVVPFTPLHDEALVRLRGTVLAYLDPTEPVAVDDWETLDSQRGLP